MAEPTKDIPVSIIQLVHDGSNIYDSLLDLMAPSAITVVWALQVISNEDVIIIEGRIDKHPIRIVFKNSL